MDAVGSLNPRSFLLGNEAFQARQVHAGCKVWFLVSFLFSMFCF